MLLISMIYSFLRFIAPFYALTLIMLKGVISHLVTSRLNWGIDSNPARLAKANFGGITVALTK